MAKQSGIHQLRGKVGEHSYYRQTGVAAGLMRSINQGMSARVKNDPAFANTRRNNSEFAGACDVAHLLGLMVTPKYRPMILPFSQSNMSKKVLEIAKVTNAIWGQRVVPADAGQQLADILTAQSKLAFTDLFDANASTITNNQLSIALSWTKDQATTMAGMGIDGVTFGAFAYNFATGKYDAISGAIRKGYRELVVSDSTAPEVVAGQEVGESIDLTIPEFSLDSKGWNGFQILVIVALPFRNVNNTPYVLQEYCRFIAFNLERAA